MKLLILTCNTGQGHNSCAAALREAAVARGMECDVHDALAFISDGFSRVVSRGHVWIYRRLPWLFRKGYRLVEQMRSFGDEGTAVYRLLSTGTRKLDAFLRAGGYDAVLCTHVFAATMLTEALSGWDSPPVTGVVATDYTCTPTTEKSRLDYYFLPHEQLIPEYLDRGVEEKRMVSVGIPVRQMFFQRLEKGAAKRAFGIDAHRDHLLIMCGSMGCGPMEKLTQQLAEKMSDMQELTVVCGTNEKLRSKLAEQYEADSRIHIRGFVEDISGLLDSADLYMTKPGGISTSEAAAKGVPMVLVDAVAGCEAHNARFFCGAGAAVIAREPEELVALCLQLLADPARRRQMARACRSLFPGNPAEEILDALQ